MESTGVASPNSNNEQVIGKKQEIISKFARKAGDTGSSEVVVALLTDRIKYLTEHFKSHHKDKHSKRGMIKLISQRRAELDYLKRKDLSRYQALIAALGIRK